MILLIFLLIYIISPQVVLTKEACSKVPICKPGSYYSNSSSNCLTCPEGFYCVGGSDKPISCPAGKFRSATGAAAVSDCIVCPSNTVSNEGAKSCINCWPTGYMTTPNVCSPCPAGGYSTPGNTSCVSCGINQYLNLSLPSAPYCSNCSAGFVCPSKTVDNEVACVAGKISDGKGGNCVSCTPGNACPTAKSGDIYASPLRSYSLANASFCPPNKACPNTDTDKSIVSCLPGYYSVGNATSCFSCPAGSYCDGSNPNGFPIPCPPGHYCPAGSAYGIPCPTGTYFSGVGAKDENWCSKCHTGHYCGTTGSITQFGDSKCDAGFYCPEGNSQSYNLGLMCPKGHFCIRGTTVPVPCPAGTYTDVEGSSFCNGCPEYYYCPKGTVIPIKCFNRHVCGPNTSYPMVCPMGTYAQDNDIALNSVSQCNICPSGVFCSNGSITGECAAGYLCEYGNVEPTPQKATDIVNVKKGGLCPIGHYCVLGAKEKKPCPNQTVGYSEGLQAVTDCSPCRPGYYCFESSVVPNECPPGYYCPGYVGQSDGLIPCPPGTYQPVKFATDSAYCIPCKAGYYCPRSALASYESFPTPVGYYSSTGQSEPYPCPGGTYQPHSNGLAAFPNACVTCPAGYFCDPITSHWNICPEGSYCPPGSAYPLHCPGAHYCPRNAYQPIDCPAGFYCPPRSAYPHMCWNGTFCPSKTEVPHLCPNGYVSINDTLIRVDAENSCRVCPPGTFSTNAMYCEPCRPGYVCLGGTSLSEPTDSDLHKGYICPSAHYCPSGSSSPMACPPGTFSNVSGGRSINACSKCPAGFYQPDYGKKLCNRCGSSSTSKLGSTHCDCIGRFRSFQPGDSSCRCIPRYIYYSEGQRISDGDSTISCQPEIYDRCPPTMYRSEEGNCVDKSDISKCDFCPGKKGQIDPEIGVCKCDIIQTYEEICDVKCIKESSTIYIDTNTNSINHFDPKTGASQSISLDSPGVVGTQGCTSGRTTCDVKLMRIRPEGTFGVFNPDFRTLSEGIVTDGSSRRELAAITSINTTERLITNPIVCLNNGDAMAWDVSHPSRERYPVYIKDSLLNTNPNFDYSAFRHLSEKMKSPNISIRTFIYTFGSEGVYTFADAENRQRITVIRVVSNRERCPISPYEPYTERSLATLGVTREMKLLLKPDWILIGALMGGLLLFVIFTIILLSCFRRKRWEVVLPKYRGDGVASLKAKEFANFASRGSTIKRYQLMADGEESVVIPRNSSRVMTVRLDMLIENFDTEYFNNVIAEEGGVAPHNIVVLSTTTDDTSSLVVRYVITGVEDPDTVASIISDLISDSSADIHRKLSILPFEESCSSPHRPLTSVSALGAVSVNNHYFAKDEFWDYERQIDLEGFNVRTLYECLEDHTIHVVSQLANQRDALVLLCDRILVENEALKDMFLKIKMNFDKRTKSEHDKLKSGAVNYDLPEDVKQVLTNFLKIFFEDNLFNIINTTNSSSNKSQTNSAKPSHRSIVNVEKSDIPEKGIYSPTSPGPAISNVFKDLFSSEAEEKVGRKANHLLLWSSEEIRGLSTRQTTFVLPTDSADQLMTMLPVKLPDYHHWVRAVVEQLISSPIMERVIKIEKIVNEHRGLMSYYIDIKDREIKKNEGILTVVDLADLNTSQFVVYCFATSVRENIRHIGIPLPQVKISIAKSLPTSQANGSAFRNSYYYDSSQQTLYIRDTRLSSIGEFMLVTLHGMAHIMASQGNRASVGWNDTDPEFLSEFYGLLEICTEEMFFMRLPCTIATRNVGSRSYRPKTIMSDESLLAMEEQLRAVGMSDREAFLKTYLML